jgi:CRP-like cAMP-binding protein
MALARHAAPDPRLPVPATAWTPAAVPLRTIADELGADLHTSADAALSRTSVTGLRLDVGDIETGDLPPAAEMPGAASGALVVDGMVLAHCRLGGRTATQLIGPGDVLQLAPVAPAVLPCGSRFTVVEEATLVLLDDRFLAIAHRWGIGRRLMDGAVDQLRRAAIQQAISQLSRVELRLVAIMWQLGERWGRMTPSGLALGLDLTHAMLGQLIGAKRPTVSLALKELEDDGTLTRLPDRTWMLANDSWQLFADEAASAVVQLITADGGWRGRARLHTASPGSYDGG